MSEPVSEALGRQTSPFHRMANFEVTMSRLRSRCRRGRQPAVAAVLLILFACGFKTWDPTLYSTDGRIPALGAEVLKVHLNSGELILLQSWNADTPDTVIGQGWRFDTDRIQTSSRQEFRIPSSEIALLEANDSRQVGILGRAGLTAWSALTGGITLICIADPKSCFGSCPTFYLDGETEVPVAEGFSSSFARALEAVDVDALGRRARAGESVALTMRNEAPETHAVRSLRVLAVPVRPTESVFHGTEGGFEIATEVLEPVACESAGKACLDAVRSVDGFERRSEADPDDLATWEEMVVVLPATEGKSAIVLAGRNTLLSTFLFYQGLAFAGTRLGEMLAEVERGNPALLERVSNLMGMLGGIEIEVAEGAGAWRPIGTFNEAGPIASDEIAFPFEATGSGPIRVRLRMVKGNWRVDAVRLARLGPHADAIAIQPTFSSDPGIEEDQIEHLRDPDRYLVTTMGDVLRMTFEMPTDAPEYELFLETQGYYYEWNRSEWIAEEDPLMVATMLYWPAAAFRKLAPAYKAMEADMEESFWASRFRRSP